MKFREAYSSSSNPSSLEYLKARAEEHSMTGSVVAVIRFGKEHANRGQDETHNHLENDCGSISVCSCFQVLKGSDVMGLSRV